MFAPMRYAEWAYITVLIGFGLWFLRLIEQSIHTGIDVRILQPTNVTNANLDSRFNAWNMERNAVHRSCGRKGLLP